MPSVIEAQGVTKTYSKGKVTALHDLSLTVEQGEIFGYLGPNGAGKSTTINVLLDMIRPSSGSIKVFGLDARRDSVAIHARIGFLPAELALWKNETARQIIQDVAHMRGNAPAQVKEADVLAQRLTFDPSKKVRDFSTGNKRKLGLILAMMHQPELLILDEPTSGLDPLLQQAFNHMMIDVRKAGRTVFLSSHVLGEVQAICDRVGILRAGELRSVETVEKLIHVGFRKVQVKLLSPIDAAFTQQISTLPGVSNLVLDNDHLALDLLGDLNPFVQFLAHTPIKDLIVMEPSLEEIFLTFYDDSRKAN